MDESTWSARAHRFSVMIDPRGCFTPTAVILRSIEVVQSSRSAQDGSNPATAAEVRDATRVVESTVHPDTNQIIPSPLRASGIIPMNTALDVGMLSARSRAATIGWQTLNQVYNAAHYYANRNGSHESEDLTHLIGFFGATATSVSCALGLRRLGTAATPSLRRMAPFLAVASADVANMLTVRHKELLHGVHVYDEFGGNVGLSRVAGVLGLGTCIIGRVIAAACVLAAPPLLISPFENSNCLLTRPWIRHPLMALLVAPTIWIFVPFIFGAVPQRMVIPVQWLESDLQRSGTGGNGTVPPAGMVRMVSFNRGF